jgi:hypothetical protein
MMILKDLNARWDSDSYYNNYATYPGLPGGANGKERNSFKPLFGICGQSKYIPLSYAPLTMEFEIMLIRHRIRLQMSRK